MLTLQFLIRNVGVIRREINDFSCKKKSDFSFVRRKTFRLEGKNTVPYKFNGLSFIVISF